MLTTSARHWQQLEAQRERVARHRIEAQQRHGRACAEVAAIAAGNTEAQLSASASEAEIAAHADRRAALMAERIAGLGPMVDAASLLRWLNDEVVRLQARAFVVRKGHESQRIAGLLARAQAPEWWRRQLRREVRQRAEAQAIHAGEVNARSGQWYASDETVKRRLLQNRRNAAILERTELENEDGQVFTLKALADKGTGNKAIRRGELMTRIRGCEEWAEAEGHRGVFLTLTAPSRFHQHSTRIGGMNPKYRGATPRDAQDWLCAAWARARARLHRIGVQAYGFRVAEPHQDGCPHWHALVWVPAGQVWRLVLAIKRHWLADEGDEPGARAHRCKAVMMRSGHASGYVAKYIAKNIDDAGAVGIEGHRDEFEGEGAELQGELWANPAVRVEAWAAAWGIRQFQAIGQPPVTVWRELRRVKAEAVESAPARVQLAWDGVNREGDQRACWATFLDMQGGTNTGREYRIRVAKLRALHHGRYEVVELAKPVGVYASEAPDVLVQSTRKEWKPRGSRGSACGATGGPNAAAARAVSRPGEVSGATRSAPPWTRVNNCTRPTIGRTLSGLGIELAMPLEGIRGGLNQWAGGLSTLKGKPCGTPPPSRPS